MSEPTLPPSLQAIITLSEQYKAAQIKEEEHENRLRRFQKAWERVKTHVGETVDDQYFRELADKLIQFGNVLRNDGWVRSFDSVDVNVLYSSSEGEHWRVLTRHVIYLYQQSAEVNDSIEGIAHLLKETKKRTEAQYTNTLVELIRHKVPLIIWCVSLKSSSQMVKASGPITVEHIPKIRKAITILKAVIEDEFRA